MSQPVLVRSSMRTWDFTLLLIVGIVVFVGGWVVFANGDRSLGTVLEVLGGLCAMGSAVGLRRRMALRQWIRLDEDGFTIIDRLGEVRYEDARVRSLALRLKQNFSEGVAKSTTRTMLIWLDSEDDDESLERLELTSTYQTDAADPLTSFIERLSQRVFQRASQRLADGSTFAGDGWVLEKQNLVIAAKPEPLHCPVDDIVMTGVVDNKLCLWRRGADEVWARISSDSVNAYVLKWLLDERLAQRPAEADSPPPEGSLGRVIFERKSGTATVVVLTLLAMALLLGGGVFLVMAWLQVNPQGDRVAEFAIGAGLLASALAFGLGAIHQHRAAFRCHQFGLVKRGLGGERSLRYEHVEFFTYQSTRHYHNGVYTGTIFVLDFEPLAEHKANRIRHTVTLRQADEELDNLRDQVSGIIANRMRHDLAAGRSVTWTPALTFQQASLIYRPSGLFGRKNPVTIPLADIESYKMDQGQCYLFRKGNTKAVVQENMHARNFFPGFYCMIGLVSEAASPAANYQNVAEVDEETQES